MRSASIRGIFFDAAGTLFRLREDPGNTYAAFAARRGVRVEGDAVSRGFRQAWRATAPPRYEAGGSAEAWEAVDRSWWRTLVEKSFRAAGAAFSEGVLDDCFDALYAYYGTAAPWEVYPETRRVLPELRKRYRLAVLSNFDARLLTVMQGLGLDECFDAIFYSAALGASKPDPEAFLQALARFGARPREVLHVGDDMSTDGRGALAAGIPFLLLNRPDKDLTEVAVALQAGV